MDASQINEVVDNLADKLGVAVEHVAPIAEEVVHQVVMRGLIQGCIGVACGIIAIILAAYGRRLFVKSISNSEGGYVVGCIFMWFFCAVMAMCGIIDIFEGLSAYVAPLTVILKL